MKNSLGLVLKKFGKKTQEFAKLDFLCSRLDIKSQNKLLCELLKSNSTFEKKSLLIGMDSQFLKWRL